MNATPSLRANSTDAPASIGPDVAAVNAQLQERTAELERMKHELDALTYAISHDLRAPIRSINGFSRILLEDHGGKLDPAALDCVATIRAAARRMTQLIDAMTALSRVSRAEFHVRRTNLSAIAAQVADELRAQAPARNVTFAIDPELSAMADPIQIQAALRHLLGNAWKFTAPQPAARIEFAAVATPAGPAFLVRDNGAGFDAQYAHKLFNPFQRLHAQDEFPGVGIGLAIVGRIILRHGGRTWAESGPGQGASFFFTLPSP